jgi:predicted nuclease of predicted toxin-antitoxin system
VRFLADMGVSGRVAEWLRERGDDVVHLRDRGLQRLADPEIMALGAAEARIVLTFDLDFGDLLAAAGTGGPSVVVFRLRDARSETVQRRLAAVLPDVAPALADGAIVIVEDGRHRVRTLPIGS